VAVRAAASPVRAAELLLDEQPVRVPPVVALVAEAARAR